MKRLFSLFISVFAFLLLSKLLPDIWPDVLAQVERSLDLVPPTQIEGFAESITVGEGSLITLVVLVTNYVLGFLGLAAITAIIYAGILYVANFGNEELTTKAKTIVTYVAIGILVVIMSYAIVNTLVGVVNENPNGGSGGSGVGLIGAGDTTVETIDSIFDVTGKDFVFPLVKTLRDLGDICTSTPIGLLVDNFGCALNEIVPDSDADGVTNVLDTDDDNDGLSDDEDSDDDGDGVCDGNGRAEDCQVSGPDLCPDTLSFVAFKSSTLEQKKLQVDRASQQEYLDYIQGKSVFGKVNPQIGCAEYQQLSDIDGDGVADEPDCDRDNDGQLDNELCRQRYIGLFGVEGSQFSQPSDNGTNANSAQTQGSGNQAIGPTTDDRLPGVNLRTVFDDLEDDDDDNDGVKDFGSALDPSSRDLLLRQLENNFFALETFIRRTCAILPQTRDVRSYCGVKDDGTVVGRLLVLLNQLSSDLSFVDIETFDRLYKEFLALAGTFKQVRAIITSSALEAELPTDGSPFRVNFDSTRSVDPYQEFCPPVDENYRWYVNKTLDFSAGVLGLLDSNLNPPDATGQFFATNFPTPGVYNVQLFVRSACQYNTVNPGAAEDANVDAAIASIASVQVRVLQPRAQLNVRIDGDAVGSAPFRVLAGTEAPLNFDLSESFTNRGVFEQLEYDCGNTQGRVLLEGNQGNWLFPCQYSNPTGRITVRLDARDTQGSVSRNVMLNFSEVISILGISPGLLGNADTLFTFSSNSESNRPIGGYLYTVEQKNPDDTFTEIEQFSTAVVSNFQFPSPGEYRVSLDISLVGSGGSPDQSDKSSQIVVIEERDPTASFRVVYPETIRPARALFDGSLSFHPDFPGTSGLSFLWEVDGRPLQLRGAGVTGPFTYDQVTAGDDSQIYYEFQTVGEHTVRLTVSRGDKSHTILEQTNIKTLLGVDFRVDKPAGQVGQVITFTPESDKAIGFFWDFGDGFTLVADTDPVLHKYDRQNRYQVKLLAEDGAGNTNEIVKTVRVGLQDAPVAFAEVTVNSIEQDLSLVDCIEVTRRDNVVFDASESVNIDGQKSRLSFLWEIEDFEEVIRTRTFTRVFKDLSLKGDGGCIDVDLTVTDLSTDKTDVIETISIEVINVEPQLTDVSYTAPERGLVTPVTVNVLATGVRDVDGRVVRYRWWYQEEGQGSQRIDLRVTDAGRTTFVIGPRNIEGTKTTYIFGVELEDNDGAVTSSLDTIGPSKPLVITNGPNVAPVAEFVVNRGVVKVGDTITFTSTTRDPLGEFIPSAGYQWDFDGDGEFERGINGSVVSYKYDAPGEYMPKLKVTKNGLNSEYDMLVRVRPSTKIPEAAFIYIQSGAKVKFVSNSTVDPALDDKNLTHAWDFDTTVDTDGNGKTDDDADSALLSPSYEFTGERDVSVGLIIRDAVGNTDQVIRRIPFVKKETLRGPLGSTVNQATTAVLKVNPAPHQLNGKVYLQPPFGDVVFNAKQSTGTLQEYRIDTNIFADSDGDGIADNDIDNKTHKSWKDGSSFKRTYRESEGKIRARLTVVSVKGQQKSQVVDVLFENPPSEADLDQVTSPDDILKLLDALPQVSFDVSETFAQPGQEITFDASRTSFPGEAVQEYRWDFNGDGLVDEISFEPVFVYAYDSEGAYDATLEAVSVDGLQGEYSQTVFIRGGLQLPTASFQFDQVDNEIQFVNESIVDPSFSPEEVLYTWSFRELSLEGGPEWSKWETVDDLEVADRTFDQGPIRVLESLDLQAAEIGQGIIPRDVVLGSGDAVVSFAEGSTLLNDQVELFVGTLSFAEQSVDLVQIPEGKEGVLLLDTGTEVPLTLSEPAELIFQGVIFSAELYQVDNSGEQQLLGSGRVEDNLTSFELKSFGGRYLITGDFEDSGSSDGTFLGLSQVKDPIKVLPRAGTYQVTLQVEDPLGELDEKTELITIDADLQVLPPGVVADEGEGVSEDSLIPGGSLDTGSEVDFPVDAPVNPPLNPQVIDDAQSGLSYFWLLLLVVIIIIVVVVVVIVVRTIRQRQSELETPQASSPGDVAEAEVVSVPRAAPKAPPAVPKATPVQAQPEEVAPKASAPASKPTAEEKKKDDQDEPPQAPTGPIPDWLKG